MNVTLFTNSARSCLDVNVIFSHVVAAVTSSKRRPLTGLTQNRKTTIEYIAFCDFKITTGIFRSVISSPEVQALSGTDLNLTDSVIIIIIIIIIAIVVVVAVIITTIINR